MNHYVNFNKIMVKSFIAIVAILFLFFIFPQLGALITPIIIISLIYSEYLTSNRELGAKRYKKTDYSSYMQSPKWQEIREIRLFVDSNKCQSCGNGEQLQVHHITYKRLGNEDIDDLVTVCKQCHKELHDYYGKNAVNYPLLRSKTC